MGLSPHTRSALRRYWADRLGVDPEDFTEAGVTVGPTDEDGVPLFCRGDALVVGAPDSSVESFERRSDALAGLDVDDGDEVREWFLDFDAVADVLGPAFWGYTDRTAFDPVESDARVLTAADESAYDEFRDAVCEEEWERGGPRFVPERTVGLFADDDLVAASGYEVWDDSVAHIAVVTRPDHRGEGYGRAVVSGATEAALIEGLIPQYRTLDAWPWSVALARRLGFERFATGYLGVTRQ